MKADSTFLHITFFSAERSNEKRPKAKGLRINDLTKHSLLGVFHSESTLSILRTSFSEQLPEGQDLCKNEENFWKRTDVLLGILYMRCFSSFSGYDIKNVLNTENSSIIHFWPISKRGHRMTYSNLLANMEAINLACKWPLVFQGYLGSWTDQTLQRNSRCLRCRCFLFECYQDWN